MVPGDFVIHSAEYYNGENKRGDLRIETGYKHNTTVDFNSTELPMRMRLPGGDLFSQKGGFHIPPPFFF